MPRLSPRHRRPPVARGVPPPGPLRRHHHPPRRPDVRRGARQGMALRRRSLYDRLRAIAGYDYTRRPSATLILTPSVWEERLTTRFCINLNLDDCYVAVETRDALERRDLRLWRRYSWVGSSYHTLKDVSAHGSPGGGLRTQLPDRKRASLPRPERMAQTAAAFGVSPSEKRTLDLVTDHPMIPREHLALWLGVSEGRVSQMMRTLVDTWGLVERRGKRRDIRYTLSAEGIRYITHRDRAQLPTTRGIWSTALTTDRQGRPPQRTAVARPHRQVRPGLQLGRFRHRPRRRGADDRRGPSDTVLPRVRASRPSSQGSHRPSETIHELLLVHRAGRRPAPVPGHPLRRGQRGRRGNLRAHRGSDDPDVATHLRVLPARSVQRRDTWTVVASTVGAGISAAGLVEAARLHLGLTVPPDASPSCRGE